MPGRNPTGSTSGRHPSRDGARRVLPNLGHISGFLRGNVISDVRLFRFDVTRRSDLELFLQAASNAPFDLKLLNDRGHYIHCNCGSTGEETIRHQVRRADTSPS